MQVSSAVGGPEAMLQEPARELLDMELLKGKGAHAMPHTVILRAAYRTREPDSQLCMHACMHAPTSIATCTVWHADTGDCIAWQASLSSDRSAVVYNKLEQPTLELLQKIRGLVQQAAIAAIKLLTPVAGIQRLIASQVTSCCHPQSLQLVNWRGLTEKHGCR